MKHISNTLLVRAAVAVATGTAALAATTAPAQAYTHACNGVDPWPNQSCWDTAGHYVTWSYAGASSGGGLNRTICAGAWGSGGTKKQYSGPECNYGLSQSTNLLYSSPASRLRAWSSAYESTLWNVG